MATVPSATTNVVDTAGAVAGGLDTICVFAPVPSSADMVPRLFGSWDAIYAMHGYSEGAEYSALHAERTKKPILFCGLPIDAPGVLGREDTSGNTGSSVTTLAAGSSGVLAEHDGVLMCLNTSTVVIGTDQVLLGLSMDGGRTFKRVRLGTNTSYAIPYYGVTVSFSGGNLKAGEVLHTWHGTAPKSATADWATARANLAAQMKSFRSIMLIGDLASDTEAAAFVAQLNAYRTANERFVYGRASVYDRTPLAALSSTTVKMTGTATLTFAENTPLGDTVTRSAGSFVSDGFTAGQILTVGTGSPLNAGTKAHAIATVTDLAITLDVLDDFAVEGPISGVTLVGEQALSFAASTDVVTRSAGSWLDDGFRLGDSITITGTVSNNGTFTVAGVTALALDLGDGLANEVIGATVPTIVAGQTKAAWMAEIDAEFATIDAEFRIDMSAGRGRVYSPITGWYVRRPAAWAASIREYAHDLHVATWRKSDGPMGFDLNDEDGNLEEWDDRVDGGAASAARFTSFRTWANGPAGAFLTLSLTRGTEGSLLSLTHNVAVVNLACTVNQLNTENVVGRSLVLNDDGTATGDSLSTIESEVNAALELALLQNRGEGPRCSKAVWTASKDDILNVPEAELTGVLELNLNGTIHKVSTNVRVISGGQ
jgi:hypothetical protein